MLFSEAAKVAESANVKELWLTHFSPSMSDPNEWINNAKCIFGNTLAGYDGLTKSIYFEN